MVPYFETCAIAIQHALLGPIGQHLQSGVFVALGSASFVIGTGLRRTGSVTKEVSNPQPYRPSKKTVAGEPRHQRNSTLVKAGMPKSSAVRRKSSRATSRGMTALPAAEKVATAARLTELHGMTGSHNQPANPPRMIPEL